MSNVVTALEPNAKQELVEGLTQAVAETAIETLKAQNYHWNVEGMGFGPLHALFQEMYEDHFAAQDELAERIKALDAHAEGRYSDFLRRSAIEECDGKVDAKAMIKNLQTDQEALSATLTALAAIADKYGDVVTNDMAIERAQVHDKFAWMLRSHLRG